MQLCGSLNILWHCLSLGWEWKRIFSSPVVTVEFSKFAGILSAALSQHHLLGFEIAQLGIPSPSLALQWCFLRPAWLQTPVCLAVCEWTNHHSYLGNEDLFCIVLLCHIWPLLCWGMSPLGLPGGTSGKEHVGQCMRCNRHGFDPWVPLEGAWQSIPVFLLGESMDRAAWQATVHRSQRVRYNWSELPCVYTCLLYAHFLESFFFFLS